MFTGTLLRLVVYSSLLVAAKQGTDTEMRKLSSRSSDITINAGIPQQIPLNIIMELNMVKNVSELFTKFMPDANTYEAQKLTTAHGFQNRTTRSTDKLEKKVISVPHFGGCSIESKSISLKDNDDPSLIYVPSCARVNRCGGCCGHDVVSCQPTKVETLYFEVNIFQLVSLGNLKTLNKKIVSIEQHSNCKCGCVAKKEDCNLFQTYDPKECRCDCNNKEEYEKCNNDEHNIKRWNSITCTCECYDPQECTEGFKINNNSCRCEDYYK